MIDVPVSADIVDRMIEEILELQHPGIPLTGEPMCPHAGGPNRRHATRGYGP